MELFSPAVQRGSTVVRKLMTTAVSQRRLSAYGSGHSYSLRVLLCSALGRAFQKFEKVDAHALFA